MILAVACCGLGAAVRAGGVSYDDVTEGSGEMLKVDCVLSAVALLAAIAAPAAGDEFCDALGSITRHAPQGFAPIEGPGDPTTFTSATIKLPAANRCTVSQREYSCEWELTSNDTLESSARALAKSIQGCHPAAKYSEEGSNGDYWFYIEGDNLSFTVNTDKSGTMKSSLGVEAEVPPVVFLWIEATD
ncbi:MAG TPA: hypothetical protein VJV39_21730 [Dongiaceae bacterium]|nr:hypothetical protein [Dongiaceae bacterium]